MEQRPTTAVLVRVRSQIPAIEAALRARGLPVEVVGLGGLLDTPEVRDVVCTLRVLADPTDGAALLRLLTGARWRIGPRDLVALHRRARALAAARRGCRAAAGRRAGRSSADRLDEATLVEALADLGRAAAYSAEGYAAAARVRPGAGRAAPPPRPAAARPGRRRRAHHRPGRRGGRPRLGGAATPGWPAATWTRSATSRPGSPARPTAARCRRSWPTWPPPRRRSAASTPGEVEVVEGAVQILTAHAAKGLEWDVVAVAGLTAGVWPGLVRGSDHYLMGIGVLPFPLRGDAAGLPGLDLSAARRTRRAWPRR